MGGSKSFCPPEWHTKQDVKLVEKVNLFKKSTLLIHPVAQPNSVENLYNLETTCIAKGDSAASHHYWRQKDATLLLEKEDIVGLKVQLPNNKLLKVTQRAQLPLRSNFSKEAKSAMIFPGLESASLVSLGQLADDNCDIVLTNNQLLTIKDKKIILTGTRNKNDCLLDIPIYRQTNQKYTIEKMSKVHIDSILRQQIKKDVRLLQAASITINNLKLAVIIKKKQTHQQLLQYLHACCYSPTKTTWAKAMTKNNIKTQPRLTTKLVNKHLPISESTV